MWKIWEGCQQARLGQMLHENAMRMVENRWEARHRTVPNWMCCGGCWTMDVGQYVYMWQVREYVDLWQS